MQTKITTVTKSCDAPGCHETLTIADNQPMTEALAIALGMWLTVIAEIVTGDGVTVHAKQFCSIDCLNKYVAPLAAEYHAAETRVLATPQPDPTTYYSPEAKAALNKEIESWEELRDRLKSEGTDGN